MDARQPRELGQAMGLRQAKQDLGRSAVVEEKEKQRVWPASLGQRPGRQIAPLPAWDCPVSRSLSRLLKILGKLSVPPFASLAKGPSVKEAPRLTSDFLCGSGQSSRLQGQRTPDSLA